MLSRWVWKGHAGHRDWNVVQRRLLGRQRSCSEPSCELVSVTSSPLWFPSVIRHHAVFTLWYKVTLSNYVTNRTAMKEILSSCGCIRRVTLTQYVITSHFQRFVYAASSLLSLTAADSDTISFHEHQCKLQHSVRLRIVVSCKLWHSWCSFESCRLFGHFAITSVSRAPGPGHGPLQSNITSFWSRNIFWTGLSPCVAFALLFLFISCKPHFTSAIKKKVINITASSEWISYVVEWEVHVGAFSASTS